MKHSNYFKAITKSLGRKLNIPIEVYPNVGIPIADATLNLNKIQFNPRYMSEMPKHYVLHVACHEVGHLVENTTDGPPPWAGEVFDKWEEDREYFAESWAVEYMGKHYPRILRQSVPIIRQMMKRYWKECPNHVKAFRRIKVYQ